MAVPAFRLIEDDLRAFFGRCCREMTSHAADPIDEFVQRHFSKQKMSSLDKLQYSAYCHVLLCNYDEDREHDQGVLFDRHLVNSGLDRDIRYCKDLRNRYAHLEGMGEPVPLREQFSDIVIVQRTVRDLTANRSRSEADKELISRLDQLARSLVDDIAKAALPDKYDRDTDTAFSELQRGQLAQIVASAITAAGGIGNGGAFDITRDSQAEVVTALADIRVALEGYRKQLEPLANLERKVQELTAAGLVPPNVRPGSMASLNSDGEEPETPQEPDRDGERLATQHQTQRLRWLSLEDARGLLIALRRRVWDETGSGPSADGLLRKSMIDAFLYHRPSSAEAIRGTPLHYMIATVPDSQRRYLPEVLDIVSRIDDEG